MNRWRKALIGATVGMAASAAFVAASHPGQAEASLVVTYQCRDGIAGAGVKVEARVTPRIAAGGMLDVGWSLSYLEENRRFGSPGFFAKGSTLDLEGVVDISGAWKGQLQPTGSKEQPELVPGSFLELPEGLSDAGSIQRPGKIRVKPGALTVRFKPAKGEVMVNDSNKAIKYDGPWWSHHTEQEFGDHLYDVSETGQQGASAELTFTGTQVAYIGRRERDLGPVQVFFDGKAVTDPLVEPGKDTNGTPMTGTKSKEVLWTSPVQTYGEHTIKIVNMEAKKAYLDAFRVTTGDSEVPPPYKEAHCEIVGDPGAIDVVVPGATPTSTPTTPTPTVTTPTPTGTGGTPTSTATTPNPNNSSPYSHTPGSSHVSVVTGGVRTATATATVTPTRSPKATTTRYVKAQVAKTPKGGVDTGEAPEPTSSSYGLIAGGSLLLMGSATGGLLLRRRQAAHAGGGR
ncbi:hypothetical protein [Nonomuraea rhodomycinica]|uniref:LPXTG-motif cell wall anchor domain-containing protein n=1 Tax=Nonomuraea rhodomycinica TaxID=1712872 RepID=A0A7Y6IWJ0_9ACTN|nr:hypothetical protein [Nonomuraea rhodomycinica]NUW45716.1 hypothetical protein [Nonomuraea rhodomycinica]